MKTFFGTKAWWAYLFILHFISPLLSPFLFLINLFVYEKWYIWMAKIFSFVLDFAHYITFHCFCSLSFYLFWYIFILFKAFVYLKNCSYAWVLFRYWNIHVPAHTHKYTHKKVKIKTKKSGFLEKVCQCPYIF